MKRSLIAAAALLMALTGCSGGEPDTPEPSATATADLKKVAERWDELTWDEQQAVCAAASAPLPGQGEVGGTAGSSPDYRLMLQAIESAGYTQGEAAAMLPYAVNQCV